MKTFPESFDGAAQDERSESDIIDEFPVMVLEAFPNSFQ